VANFEFDFPKDFLKELDIFSRGDLPEKMINAGLPIYQKSIQNELILHRQSGALINSVKSTKAKASRNNAIIGNVIFKGYDADGTPNVLKAMALQYGNYKQEASPFMEAATRKCEDQVIETMQEVFNTEVGE
jgi:hypothetical protein